MAQIDRVVPVLVYEDLAAAHDFLVSAFGFEAGGVDRDAGGTPIHAEVRAGKTVIWLHRVTEDHGTDSPRRLGPVSSGLVVHVSNVDEHYRRALAAGARVEGEPVDQPYGQREYGAYDLEGHRWWFATPRVPEGAA